MARPGSRWTDERLDLVISAILRAGVSAAALVVLAGGIYYLARHGGESPAYHLFRSEPAQLRSVSGVLRFAFASHSRGIVELGLLLLIATPIARVIFSVFAFGAQRDRTYAIITLIVLGVLLFNLIWGYR